MPDRPVGSDYKVRGSTAPWADAMAPIMELILTIAALRRRQPVAAGLAKLAGMLQPSMAKAVELPRCVATMHVGACLWAKCAIRPAPQVEASIAPAADAGRAAGDQRGGLLVMAVTCEGILYEWAVGGFGGASGPKCVLQGQHRLPCHAVVAPVSASRHDEAQPRTDATAALRQH